MAQAAKLAQQKAEDERVQKLLQQSAVYTHDHKRTLSGIVVWERGLLTHACILDRDCRCIDLRDNDLLQGSEG